MRYKRDSGGGGSSITIETNGVPNGNQSLLNFIAGLGMSITDDGLGNITFTSTGSGGGLDKLNIIPTGLKDGFNTVFTLPTAPNPADSLMLFLNGAFQENGGVDYTLVGNVITFVNPPVLNSNIVAFYNDNGGSSGGTSFVQAFVIADWVLNGVNYELNINHNLNSLYLFKNIQDSFADDVFVNKVHTVDANNVLLSVPVDPDLRFDGSIIVGT